VFFPSYNRTLLSRISACRGDVTAYTF